MKSTDNKFLTRYNHAVPVSPAGGASVTDPQFAAECDIATLIKRYHAGDMSVVRPTNYGDFTSVGDYATALERVRYVQGVFDSLPADLRSRFGNASNFCEFAVDPANLRECVELGIFERAEVDPVLESLKNIAKGVTAKADAPVDNGAA